jgi:hypothetical protein
METVTLWNVAAYGWTCVSEQDFGVTAVSTWTRDEQVLVLVWQGAGDVTAAVLDGEVVPLDRLHETVVADEFLDDSRDILGRAESHASQHIAGRLGDELATVMDAAAQAERSQRQAPIRLRNSIRNLALAILSSPVK